MSDTTGTQGTDPTGNELLASAYLDSEVTDRERAQVESSPELLAEVERLRQVRAVLGATTEPPAISVREAHLAAALDVWDRMPESERAGEVTPSAGMDAAAAAAISTPSPTSLNARRSRRSGGGSTKWLLGAAAGLAVIAGAGIVLQSVGSGDDDGGEASDAGDTQAPAEAAVSEDELVADMAADEFVGEEVESAPIEINEDDLGGEDARFDEVAAEAPADEPAEEPAEEPAAEAEVAAEDAPAEEESSDPASDPAPPEIDLFVLETPADLGDFGAAAAYAPVDLDAPAEPNIERTFNTCDVEFAGIFEFETFAGPALYQGEQVVVAVDITADPPSVIAYTDTCEFVASAPLPPEDVFNQRQIDDQDAG